MEVSATPSVKSLRSFILGNFGTSCKNMEMSKEMRKRGLLTKPDAKCHVIFISRENVHLSIGKFSKTLRAQVGRLAAAALELSFNYH